MDDTVHLKVVHVEFFDADFVIFTFIKKYKGMTSDLVAISFPKEEYELTLVWLLIHQQTSFEN